VLKTDYNKIIYASCRKRLRPALNFEDIALDTVRPLGLVLDLFEQRRWRNIEIGEWQMFLSFGLVVMMIIAFTEVPVFTNLRTSLGEAQHTHASRMVHME